MTTQSSGLTAPSVAATHAHALFISLGRNASDANPQRTACTWAQFVQWLRDHPRTPAGITPEEYARLKSFPSKSPEGLQLHAEKDGAYVVLADHGGQRRALDTVLASYGVPLDFDSGQVTAEVIQQTLAGYAYVTYTTYAHQPGAERWRVFVPVARPMTAAEHYATWAMLSAAFPGGADAAAKDASRLSYLPGKCLVPEAAAIFHADGAFFQPVPAAPPVEIPLTLQHDGPVPGWAGPTDDAELLRIACSLRMRPDERFGGPIHFAALWHAQADWLAQKFPSATQPWDYTQADMALAGELAYWTGRDAKRMAELMRQSGLAHVRAGDDDWSERKVLLAVERAAANAKQFHFMTKVAEPNEDAPRVVATAAEAALANVADLASLNDYYAFHQTGEFIHRPTGDLHPATVLDNVIGKDARMALYSSRPVHRMTWAPGYPERFRVCDLDPTDHKAAQSWLYNRYQPPRMPDRSGDVTPWLELIRKLYPENVDHIVNYFADAVQFPQHKCNHALVLGSGVHGIGKDTLLAPLRHAVGHRNFAVIKPSDLVTPYNPWAASRVIQISESRDLGEGHAGISRFDMYERCKDYTAAPPTTLLCNDKYVKQHQVLNVCRVVLTTNHAVDGLYLHPEDRRHYCAWSDAEKMDEDTALALYEWYGAGGLDFVANHLATLNLDARGWNRSARPAQTAWWHQLVEGGLSAEDERFNDALDKLGRPEWVTLAMIAGAAGLELAGWIASHGNKRKVEREMDRAGYRRFPNPAEPKKGRWYVEGRRVVVYRRADVAINDLLHKFGAG